MEKPNPASSLDTWQTAAKAARIRYLEEQASGLQLFDIAEDLVLRPEWKSALIILNGTRRQGKSQLAKRIKMVEAQLLTGEDWTGELDELDNFKSNYRKLISRASTPEKAVTDSDDGSPPGRYLWFDERCYTKTDHQGFWHVLLRGEDKVRDLKRLESDWQTITHTQLAIMQMMEDALMKRTRGNNGWEEDADEPGRFIPNGETLLTAFRLDPRIPDGNIELIPDWDMRVEVYQFYLPRGSFVWPYIKIWIDDALENSQSARSKAMGALLYMIATMGRHFGVALTFLSQSPFALHPDVKNNADFVVQFADESSRTYEMVADSWIGYDPGDPRVLVAPKFIGQFVRYVTDSGVWALYIDRTPRSYRDWETDPALKRVDIAFVPLGQRALPRMTLVP